MDAKYVVSEISLDDLRALGLDCGYRRPRVVAGRLGIVPSQRHARQLAERRGFDASRGVASGGVARVHERRLRLLQIAGGETGPAQLDQCQRRPIARVQAAIERGSGAEMLERAGRLTVSGERFAEPAEGMCFEGRVLDVPAQRQRCLKGDQGSIDLTLEGIRAADMEQRPHFLHAVPESFVQLEGFGVDIPRARIVSPLRVQQADLVEREPVPLPSAAARASASAR